MLVKPIFFAVFILFLSGACFGTTYYVSSQGNDLNTGITLLDPFRTIAHLNTLSFNPGDSILFRSGDRFQGELVINNSGNNSNAIYIGAYGTGDMPELIGGDTLFNWNNFEGPIYRTHFGATIKLLTVNSEQQMLARHPNEEWFALNIGAPNTDLQDLNRIGDPDWSGATLLVMNNDWSLNPYSVQSFNSGTGDFVVANGVTANPSSDVEYCIVDHLEALDSPGEWYQDPLTDSIYLWTFDGQDPSLHDVLASTRENGIYILGNYVKVEGLKINCFGHSGIRFDNRHHIEITSNDIRNVKRHGIYSLFGHTNKILNNTIRNVGHFGIVGYDTPNSIIHENRLMNVGLYHNISELGLQTSKGSGIRFSGDSLVIENNKLENIGYNGIHFKGVGCAIQSNVIKYFSKTTWDSGAIYCWNQHFDSLGSSGTWIKNNIIIGGMDSTNVRFPDNRKAFGIYTDDRIHNVEVRDNFVAQTFVGIFLHNNRFVTAHGNELYNNWDNDIRLTTDAIVSEGDMYGNIVEQNRLFRTDTIRNNLGVRCRWSTYDLGDYDSNYFYQPYYDSSVNFSYRPDDVNEEFYNYSLNDWSLFSGNDLNSVSAPFQWPQNMDYSMFVVNETDSIRNIPLNGNWIGFDSVLYSGNILLDPFNGKVIWMAEDCNNQIGGTAFIDSCDICSGGGTGITPILNVSLCDLKALDIEELSLKVYPNPAAEDIILSIGDALIGSRFTVLDQMGRILSQRFFVERENLLDISNYDKGIYFIQTDLKSNHVKIIKF